MNTAHFVDNEGFNSAVESQISVHIERNGTPPRVEFVEQSTLPKVVNKNSEEPDSEQDDEDNQDDDCPVQTVDEN